MKKFEAPEMKVDLFDIEDVITTSNPNGNDNPKTGDNMGDWA